MAPVWRSRAAALKGVSMGVYGVAVLALTVYNLSRGALPDAGAMGAIGLLALIANLSVAVLLFRFRSGDANMRSVWLCTRNDAIGNVAVILAALGVFGTGAGWPDLIVAAIMATLGLTAARQVLRQAGGELGWWPTRPNLTGLEMAFAAELERGYLALKGNDLPEAYRRFERAHVLGQARTAWHLRSHLAFLQWSITARDPREVLGQVLRIAGAAALTWVWIPRGNTGGARVSALRSMPIEPDLQSILHQVER